MSDPAVTWDSSRTWCLALIQLIWKSLSHMLLGVSGPQVLSMLLAPKPDAQPPAGHQLRGCWRTSWKGKSVRSSRGAVLQEVSACCAGPARTLFFSCGLPCSQDRDPNWTGNALIDHPDEKRRLVSRTSAAQCHQASQQVM